MAANETASKGSHMLSGRPQKIIQNQLFRRQRSIKLTAQNRKHDESEKEADETYVVLTFSSKAKFQQCKDVQNIIGQFGIKTTLEFVNKQEKYLYLSASTKTLLLMADEAELTKMTITGCMKKFSVDCVKDFILPGMTEDDIVRFCEGPVLIKDVVKPQLMYYIRNGIVEDLFPLHDIEYLDKFSFDWHRRSLPIEDVRNYFGSSIALFFAFTEFYTKALIFPTLFGICQYMYDINLSFVIGFHVIWTTVFQELWKRKCAAYAYRWGNIEMSSLDKPRTNYKGRPEIDPISGKKTLQYPMRYTYIQMYAISYPVVLLCVIAAGYFALYQFHIEAEVLADFGPDSWLLYIPVIVQSILIAIFSWAYEKLATFLTELENHRTRLQYERHRVNKLMIFEIVNNFFSLFYIAFVLQDLKQLNYQLMMQLLIFQLVCIAQEVGIPLLAVIRQKLAKYRHKELDDRTSLLVSVVSRYEQCFFESGLDKYQSTYEDYLQMCIQFGYVVLFAAVAPFAAFGALINNIFAMHIDMWKLCNIFKRPFARRAKNIGAWQSAFELLSVMAILSNCGLLYMQPNVRTFVANHFPSMPNITFVIFEHLLLGLKFVIHKAIHERPRWVRIALMKDDYESNRLYKTARLFEYELNNQNEQSKSQFDKENYFQSIGKKMF